MQLAKEKASTPLSRELLALSMYNYLPTHSASIGSVGRGGGGGGRGGGGGIRLGGLAKSSSLHSLRSSTGERSNAPSTAGSQSGSAPDSHLSHGSMSQLGSAHYDWYHENEQATAAQAAEYAEELRILALEENKTREKLAHVLRLVVAAEAVAKRLEDAGVGSSSSDSSSGGGGGGWTPS